MKRPVLHIIPSLEGGGAERQAFLLLKELRRRGWELDVCVTSVSKRSFELQEDGIRIHLISSLSGFGYLKAFFSILFLSIRIKPRIINTWLSHMDILGGLVAIILNIDWILNERSSKEAYLKSEATGNAVNPIVVGLRKKLGRFTKYIISNSLKGREYWSETLPPEKVFFVPNCVNRQEITNTEFSPQLVAEDSTNKPYIISVGSLIPSKNYEVLLKALPEALKKDDFILYLIGSGPLEVKLNDYIIKNSMSSNVKLLGHRSDWWGLLKDAACLIHPSLYEGMPNVVIEAMAAKCPLILSDIDAHGSIADKSSALFFNKTNPKDLAININLVLNRKLEAVSRSEIAFDVVSRFTLEHTTSSYEEIYERIN